MQRKRKRQHITRLVEPRAIIDNITSSSQFNTTTTSPSPSFASSNVDNTTTAASAYPSTSLSPSASTPPSILFFGDNSTALSPSPSIALINNSTSPSPSPSVAIYNTTTTPSGSPSIVASIDNTTDTTAAPSNSPSIIISVFNNSNTITPFSTSIPASMDNSSNTLISDSTQYTGTSLIGGQAFHDTNNDGLRDDFTAINGFGNVNVWLYSCNDPNGKSQVVAYVKTASNGIYRFPELGGGRYYIIAQPPEGYQFSDPNSNDNGNGNGGVFDTNNNIISEGGGGGGGGMSTINPQNGRTICFELPEGKKTMDWSFGLYKPTDTPSASPTTSNKPTIIIDGDSESPSIRKSESPSQYPSDGPTTLDPTTLKPTEVPTLMPTTLTPTRFPSSFLPSDAPSEINSTDNTDNPSTQRPTTEEEDETDDTAVPNPMVSSPPPSEEPTQGPALVPTKNPSRSPSLRPSSAKRRTVAPTVMTTAVPPWPSWSPSNMHNLDQYFDGIDNNNNGNGNGNLDGSNNNNNNDSNNSDMGMIIGIICGLVAFLAILATIVYLIAYRRGKKEQHNHDISEVQVPIMFGDHKGGVDKRKGTCATSIDYGGSASLNTMHTLEQWDEKSPTLMNNSGSTTSSQSHDTPVIATPVAAIIEAARTAIRSSSILSKDEKDDLEAGIVPPPRSYSQENNNAAHVPKLVRESQSVLSNDERTLGTIGSGTIGSLTFGSGNSSGESYRRPLKSHIISIPTVSPALAAEADRDTIRNLEKEISTLTMALEAYPKHSQAWLLLNGYLERAQEELEAVKHDIGYNPLNSSLDKNLDNSQSTESTLDEKTPTVPLTYAYRNGKKLPVRRSHSPEDDSDEYSLAEEEISPDSFYQPVLSPVSEESFEQRSRSNTPVGSPNDSDSIQAPPSLQSQSTSHSTTITPHLRRASASSSSQSNLEVGNDRIHSIEDELNALSVAIQSYPKNSQEWLQLRSYLDQAPHIIDVIVKRGINLGLVVDKPHDGDGGPVFIRNLHQLSPLRDKIQLGDKIIAIDDVDVRELSAVEVGRMLSRNGGGGSSDKKITVMRENGGLAEEQLLGSTQYDEQLALTVNYKPRTQSGLSKQDNVPIHTNGSSKRESNTAQTTNAAAMLGEDQTENDALPKKEEFDLSHVKQFVRELDEKAKSSGDLPTKKRDDVIVTRAVPETISSSPVVRIDPKLEISRLRQADEERRQEQRKSEEEDAKTWYADNCQKSSDVVPTQISLEKNEQLEGIADAAAKGDGDSSPVKEKAKGKDRKAVSKYGVQPTNINAGCTSFADELAKRATSTEKTSQQSANKATTMKRYTTPPKTSQRKKLAKKTKGPIPKGNDFASELAKLSKKTKGPTPKGNDFASELAKLSKKTKSPTPKGNDFASELAKRTSSSNIADKSAPEEGGSNYFASMLAKRASEVIVNNNTSTTTTTDKPTSSTAQMLAKRASEEIVNNDTSTTTTTDKPASSTAQKKKKKKRLSGSLRGSFRSVSSKSSGFFDVK